MSRLLFSVLALSLGACCVGFPIPFEFESAASTFQVPSGTSMLVQTPEGLWTPEGDKVAELGGSQFPDAYLIDVTKDEFFLLSDDTHTVRVARRSGDRFEVHVLVQDARVIRPIGGVALIKHRGGDLGAQVIDSRGIVLMEGVWNRTIGEDPPVDQPEYWWSSDYFGRPAPICEEGGKCGWVRLDGRWLREKERGRPAAPPMLPVPVEDGTTWYGLDGVALQVDAPARSEAGPGSEGLAVIGLSVMESGFPTYRSQVFELATGKSHPIPLVLQWEGGGCPQFSDRPQCRYAYHQGLAMVVVENRTAQQSMAYVGPDGSVAIGPGAPCIGYAPSGPFHQDRAFHCDGDAYWMIDREGHRLAGPYSPWKANIGDRNSYYNGLHFSDGLAAVPVDGGWAYVDREGEIVLPGPYAVARPFRMGFAQVLQDGEVLFIGQDGSPRFR